MNKKELRKKILDLRSQLAADEVKTQSQTICTRVTEEKVYEETKNVCLYMPVRNEVDVSYLLTDARDSEKNVWLPKVRDNDMEFCLYAENTELVSGAYGIPEPSSEYALEPDEGTLIIMPGAVFSCKGDRIGYGGGYYDRYLEKYPMCKTIAVCYDFQLLDDIPYEPHDIKPHRIISEKRAVTCNLTHK